MPALQGFSRCVACGAQWEKRKKVGGQPLNDQQDGNACTDHPRADRGLVLFGDLQVSSHQISLAESNRNADDSSPTRLFTSTRSFLSILPYGFSETRFWGLMSIVSDSARLETRGT